MDYEEREFFKQRFTREELTSILERAGLRPAQLVSTRSTVYRNERLAERELAEEEWLAWLLAEPRLVRRPILVSDDGVEIGFGKARYEELARQLAG